MEDVLRAHEWFDLLDDEFDQAVFRQTSEQNRFDQHVGNDLVVDGDMFEVFGNEQIKSLLEGDGADRGLPPDDQPVAGQRFCDAESGWARSVMGADKRVEVLSSLSYRR